MSSFTETDATTIAQDFVEKMEKKECDWRFSHTEKCRIFKRKWNVVYHVFDSEGVQINGSTIVVVNEMDKSASVFPGFDGAEE